MAEAGQTAQSANGQGNANLSGQGQANQGSNQPQQSQEPKWFSYIPEAEREEVKKGWMMEGDYRKKTAELSEQRKAWEAEKAQLAEANKKYADWWAGFEPTYKTISANWDKIQSVLSGKAPVTNQPTSDDDPFRDYDVLPPAEQAKKIAEYVNAQHVSKALQAQEQKFNQTLAQREQYYQNYMNILTDAFNRKFQHPDLSIPDFLAKALEFSYGKGNPLDMAYSVLTKDSDLKKQQEQWEKAGYEKAKLELENQRQANGAVNDGFIPLFKQTPLSRDQIAEAVRQEATSKGIAW